MKRVSCVVFACLMLAGLAGCGNGGGNVQASELSGEKPAAAVPKLKKGESLFDFGSIPNKPPVSHEFILENKTGKEIHITGKTNSCGCTTSEIDKETILPGDKAVVKVTFNPAGYDGDVSQYVFVNTDDPENPFYRFSIKAYVR